jgi:hypothetical protein
MLIGVAAALLLFPPRPTPDESDESDERTRLERLATERNNAASVAFQTALDTCRGLPTRLTRIAEAAEAKATALRDGQAAGLIAGPHHVSADWRPPWELRHDSPRLPVIAWQLLDRAFDQLTAALDDPNADLHTRACAFEEIAKAAREVAKQLRTDDGQRELSSELARCAFCGKRGRDVRKVIAGPTSAICDECVDLCVEVLEEELGDDWRAPPP